MIISKLEVTSKSVQNIVHTHLWQRNLTIIHPSWKHKEWFWSLMIIQNIPIVANESEHMYTHEIRGCGDDCETSTSSNTSDELGVAQYVGHNILFGGAFSSGCPSLAHHNDLGHLISPEKAGTLPKFPFPVSHFPSL